MNFKKLVILIPLVLLISCGENPFAVDPRFLAGEPLLSFLPVDRFSVSIMAPYGDVGFFHNGIDISTHGTAPFYSCSDGIVIEVNLNTNAGYPGTNYRIRIQASPQVIMEYHFEIGGFTTEQDRKNNIFVSKGDWILGGQAIANLLILSDAAHVHFQVEKNGNSDHCPLDFFTPEAAQAFEAMYDDPTVIKHLPSRQDLC
jgi:hypothetical protein